MDFNPFTHVGSTSPHLTLYLYHCRRYKMISQYTWPNFPTGDAEEGTKMLLEDRKLVKDVTFGKTKIFVRTPATLFELEKARSDLELK